MKQAEQGDNAAKTALRRYEGRLARALSHVINMLDPDVIVLGGGMSNISRLYKNVPALWDDYVFSDVSANTPGPAALWRCQWCTWCRLVVGRNSGLLILNGFEAILQLYVSRDCHVKSDTVCLDRYLFAVPLLLLQFLFGIRTTAEEQGIPLLTVLFINQFGAILCAAAAWFSIRTMKKTGIQSAVLAATVALAVLAVVFMWRLLLLYPTS